MATAAAVTRAEDLYDMVIKARQFREVYDMRVGWAVDPYNEATIAARNVQTVFVAPVGHFNAGKTFVTNKLSGKNLPCGDRKHTEGLSIAVTRTNPGGEVTANQPIQQIAWMDTAGMNSPVVQNADAVNTNVPLAQADLPEHDPAKAAEHGREAMDALYTQLREVKRLEDFHRRVAFEFADVFLFVINQISAHDQLEILLLLQQIQRAGANKSVFVVHNLRGWNKGQMDAKREDDHTYISRIKTLFFMQETKVNVTAVIDDAKNLVFGGSAPVGDTHQVTGEVTKLYGTFNHPTGSRVEMQHVFLVDDSVDHRYNACVLTHLRNEVTLVLSRPGSVKWHVENVMTKVQHLFAQTNSQHPPLLRIVPKPAENPGLGAWRVHVVESEKVPTIREIKTAARSLQLPSYLTLGSDDLQYNVLKLKGSTATTAAATSGGGNVGPGAVEKIMYAVQFVIPGLHPDDVEQIKGQMKWNGGALRLEQSPEGRKALVIDFGSTEHIAQAQLLQKIQSQIDRETIMFTELESEIMEDGTRPFFDREKKSRPVTVQIRTGLEKLSTMTRPLVAYNDGILSIVVTSSERPPKAVNGGGAVVAS